MKKQLIILEKSVYFNRCDLVEGFPISGGYQVGKHFVSNSECAIVTEKLEKSDEERVKKIVREILKKMFWRQYTRASFILR